MSKLVRDRFKMKLLTQESNSVASQGYSFQLPPGVVISCRRKKVL